jgi:methionine salvage enolase-phosphatase E1
MKGALKLLMVIALLVLPVGCMTTQQEEEEVVDMGVMLTEEQLKEEFLDDKVPLYPGFKLVPSKSFIYESGSIKVNRLVLVGKADIKDIVSYYKTTLMERGWEPISVIIHGNSAELIFTSPDEVLQIKAEKGFSSTTLVIQLGPRGLGAFDYGEEKKDGEEE